MEKIVTKEVVFNGANLMAVQTEDKKIYVGVKWICQGLGLTEGQTKAERIRVNDDVVLTKGRKKIVLPTKGGNQEVLCIELHFLPLWLAKINANIIDDPIVQDKLVEYQLNAADVLAKAFIEEDYYNPKPIIPELSPELQVLINLELKAKEQQKQIEEMRSNLTVINSRVDTLDSCNIKGDKQQKLNAMIRKYAFQTGMKFETAWKEFRSNYNTAFRTNVKLALRKYKEKYSLKNLSLPEFLSKTKVIDDALRIADKMLASIRNEGATK